MTPTPSPEAVEQIVEASSSGIEPAVIAALVTGGVAILVAIIGNLWSWYIARKTLADSQKFERERLDRLIQDERERHDADLRARHEESVRGDRIKALSAYNQEVTEFVRFVAGVLSTHPNASRLLEHQGQLDILFAGELVKVTNKLTDRSIELCKENTGYRGEGGAKTDAQVQAEGDEMILLHNEFLTLARKHITEPPNSK